MVSNNRREARPPSAGVREAPFALAAPTGDGLTLDGFAAVFGRETIIDSWEGRFREQVASGSMRRSFRETPPTVQFDHGRHMLIGSMPIAELQSIAEETDPVRAPEGGAHVVARVFDNWMMAPLRDAIAAQAINGMSFRFEVLKEYWMTHDGQPIADERQLQSLLMSSLDLPEDELPLRTLKELKVPELGPVVWPAYQDTSVSMRSVIDLHRLHEPEQRKLLATAVYLVDAAEQSDIGDQRATDATVGEREPESSDSGQQATDTTVGAHPSIPPLKPRGLRPMDLVLRNQRDTLISIERVRDDRRSAIHTARGSAFSSRAHLSAVREAARRNPRPHGGNRRTG